jgi:hypothetical protein
VHFWVCFEHCHARALSWDLRLGNAYKWLARLECSSRCWLLFLALRISHALRGAVNCLSSMPDIARVHDDIHMSSFHCYSTPKFAVSSYSHWSIPPGFHSVHLDSLLTPERSHSELTMLENFSRTVRNYIPSSIPIPTASPAPRHVFRPISVRIFMPSTLLSTSPAPPPDMTKRRGSSGSSQFGLDVV